MDDNTIARILFPADDGEPPIRHRLGKVLTVNTNGTVTLTMGTSSVVARILEGVMVAVGDVVEVVVWSGDVLILGRPRPITAHDTATESATFTTTTPHTFTHTPVGTPRGVLVTIDHGTPQTDVITSVTYGGVAMARVSTAADAAGEDGRVYAYFLGTGIPVGAQTVSIVHSGSATVKHAVAISVLAPSDTCITGVGTLSADQANPQLALPSEMVGQRYCVIYSGKDTVSDLTPLAGMTAVHDHDFGTFVSRVDRQTTPSSGTYTIGYTATSDDVAMIAIAIGAISSSRRRIDFVTVPSVSLNSMFAVGDDTYALHGYVASSGAITSLNMRLRAAGVDLSAANYYEHYRYGISTAWGAVTSVNGVVNAGTSWTVGYRDSTNFDLTLKRVGVASISKELQGLTGSDGATQVSSAIWGRTAAIAVMDGFTIYPDAAVMISGFIVVKIV
jgi:hypothetical protein